MKKQNTVFQLPRKLSTEWTLDEILSTDSLHTVCCIQKKEDTGEKKILKYYAGQVFSKKKLHRLLKLSDKHLMLPDQHKIEGGALLLFYAREDTLYQILQTSGLSLQEILALGIDLSLATEYLKKMDYLEADISPCNIYRKTNGSFCLGDLNIDRKPCIGTPPFIAPEVEKSLSSGSDSRKRNPVKQLLASFRPAGLLQDAQQRFDYAMQYAIGRLLYELLRLHPAPHQEALLMLLQRAMSSTPADRFESLAALGKALTAQQTELAAQSDQIFKPTPKELMVFQRKTRPLDNTSSLPALITSGLFLVAGCLFILCIRSVHQQGQPIHSDIAAADAIETFASARNTKNTLALAEFSPDPVFSEMNPEGINGEGQAPDESGLPDEKGQAPDESGLPDEEGQAPDESGLPDEEGQVPDESELRLQNKGYYSFLTATKHCTSPASYTCLYGGENHFSSLEGLHRFTSLKELYLNHNQLTDISECSTQKQLSVLILSYNQLTDISALKKLTKLNLLDLSSNPRLTKADTLLTLKNLRTLNISNTGISKAFYKRLKKALPNCHIIYVFT